MTAELSYGIVLLVRSDNVTDFIFIVITYNVFVEVGSNVKID